MKAVVIACLLHPACASAPHARVPSSAKGDCGNDQICKAMSVALHHDADCGGDILCQSYRLAIDDQTKDPSVCNRLNGMHCHSVWRGINDKNCRTAIADPWTVPETCLAIKEILTTGTCSEYTRQDNPDCMSFLNAGFSAAALKEFNR